MLTKNNLTRWRLSPRSFRDQPYSCAVVELPYTQNPLSGWRKCHLCLLSLRNLTRLSTGHWQSDITWMFKSIFPKLYKALQNSRRRKNSKLSWNVFSMGKAKMKKSEPLKVQNKPFTYRSDIRLTSTDMRLTISPVVVSFLPDTDTLRDFR